MTEAESTHFLGCVRRGISFRASCLSAGLTVAKAQKALAVDDDLRARFEKAQADAEVILVAQMQELAKTDSRAASWLLAHVNPDRYGKPRPAELTDEEVREIW